MEQHFTTLVRAACNLLSGTPEDWLTPGQRRSDAVREAVATVRKVVKEVQTTEADPMPAGKGEEGWSW